MLASAEFVMGARRQKPVAGTSRDRFFIARPAKKGSGIRAE
jgi:hypothetical protein